MRSDFSLNNNNHKTIGEERRGDKNFGGERIVMSATYISVIMN